ncbi:uncharacterized protein LOC134222099 [Armigeres subalbatus]|uniref:uncharacterized protein LOC134222099 n=1 Tax=Armigeres subalbatus TaxID=124917 RepID=UPI002ED1BC53
MYRQIRIHPEDTCLQRIVWRFNPSEPIHVYELQTVTYGLSPSSFLATRVLQKLAEDSGNQYEHAAPKVSKDFYMDDFLSGANSVIQARGLRKEVQALLAEGGLLLRKWNSNHPEVLDDLPTELNNNLSTMYFETTQKIKTLGVIWEIKSDHFGIERVFPPLLTSSYLGKNKDAASLVDRAEWDDPIPEDIYVKWQEYYQQLPLLKSFKVSRYLFTPEPKEIQFHIFSDASELAYGACIYARSTNKDGQTKTELISAKSRVAPLKRVSLPRLELCAALLGARLYARISAALGMEEVHCWFWSDSTVTLHWIQAPSSTWQSFIGNRTSEIQRLTHGHTWNHVRGIDNPADYISRGLLPEKIVNNTVWRNGPVWLSQEKENWPKQQVLEPILDELLERKNTTLLTDATLPDTSLFERYSSFWKLVRVTAYILRFISRCRKKSPQQEPFITVPELQAAKEALVKGVQHQIFFEEVKALNKKQSIPSKSPLKNCVLR